MTITLVEAQHRLNTLAEMFPYKKGVQPDGNCAYFEYDNSPSCIVGHALASEFQAAGIVYGSFENTDAIGSTSVLAKVDIEPLAVNYLSTVQEQQDFGIPWAEAVKYADIAIAEEIADLVSGTEFAIEPDGQLVLA